MRLIEWGGRELVVPDERGDSVPQFYENGDKFHWANPMMWHYRFWNLMLLESTYPHPTDDEQGMLLMGGEL
jgi:hypothetical protein